MNQNQKQHPNDAANSTGMSSPYLHPGGVRIIRPAVRPMSSGIIPRVVIVKGQTGIPAVGLANNPSPRRSIAPKIEPRATRTPPPPQQIMEREIKEEPNDEEMESYGAKANIMNSRPINCQDLMPSYNPSAMLREEDIKREASPPLVLHLKRRESDAPSSSSSSGQLPVPASFQKSTPKRIRKSGRHDDYVYDQEHEEHDSSPEPPSKNKKTTKPAEGCRCEYIVPELDSKMDRIMDKMSFIETLAKSMLVKEETNLLERSQAKESLEKAQNEIQHLRRQLIVQRNHGVSRPDNNSY